MVRDSLLIPMVPLLVVYWMALGPFNYWTNY